MVSKIFAIMQENIHDAQKIFYVLYFWNVSNFQYVFNFEWFLFLIFLKEVLEYATISCHTK